MERIESIELRVSEAETKNVGRGIAQMDPKDIQEIGIEIGDVIEIQGKRTTPAKVLPSPIEKRGRDSIQIDGITRANAQVGLDEKVLVKKAEVRQAERVTLKSKGSIGLTSKELIPYLESIPIIKGDKIRVTLPSGRARDFEILDTVPEGVVILHSRTRLRLKTEGALPEPGLVTYEDVGGLDKEIQRIREMIELPLRFPEVFEKLGIEPPKGVLFYGPPGCGKTLLSRAIANESGCSFFHISGPEIFHKFYGESEAHLREIFNQAQAAAPAILFIDELDAIASKREAIRADQLVERRVSAQLLALMDGIKERGKIIVIGATNIPEVIDPALRRPGRFDREIAIGIPDKEGRLDILEIHTRAMPLAPDLDLRKIAEITHGFVGADLAGLCREAAMKELRTIFPDIDFAGSRIPYGKLESLQVTEAHFMDALGEIEPSALREVLIETPDIRWSDVGGLEEVKKVLQDTIEYPLKHGYLFEYAKTAPPKGILLFGPPGTGKTLVAKAVARESEVNFISVRGPQLMSMWVGETERGIRETFRKAKQAKPCIIFFDELDAIASRRSILDTSRVTERAISQFCTELDGIEELKGVVVIGATNRKDLIDEALLRPGRFDFQLEFPIPDQKTKLEIFKIHTRGKPLAKDLDFKKLIELLGKGATGADIESLCRAASILAIREFIQKKVKDKSKFLIEMRYFEEVLKSGKREEE